MSKEMTEEEIEKFRIESSQLFEQYRVNQEARAKNYRTITDKDFRDSLDILFESCLSHLHGEYQIYTVYEDSNETPANVYALVYAEYYEKYFTSEENFLEVYKQDAIYLAQKLKESSHPLHYYYIMPYYNFVNGNSALYNSHIILTNELTNNII